jgi:hypothetical protein
MASDTPYFSETILTSCWRSNVRPGAVLGLTEGVVGAIAALTGTAKARSALARTKIFLMVLI